VYERLPGRAAERAIRHAFRPAWRLGGRRQTAGPGLVVWLILVPLLGIPAFVIAGFVSFLLPMPPDFCGQAAQLTCQQADAGPAPLALWPSGPEPRRIQTAFTSRLHGGFGHSRIKRMNDEDNPLRPAQIVVSAGVT
jgi:hypothetical protein